MSNYAKIREDALKLNPIDDAMFVKMADDIGFCEELLQVILEDKELHVDKNHHQYAAKNLQGRSCTLDLVCKLGTGHTVLVEVQKADDDDHQRRVRYESALLTTNTTAPGTKFEKVPDVISIFISRFDIFKQQNTIYHVDRVLRETGQVVDNGAMEIYVNAQIDDGTDIADLMKLFSQDDVYYDKFPKASARKKIFKTTEEGVNQMCEIIERNRTEAATAAAAAATTKTIVNSIKTLMRTMNLTAKQAMTALEIPVTDYEKYLVLL